MAPIRATGSIKMNLTSIGELGRLWQSQSLINFESTLAGSSSSANAGGLQGNRMFYTNDYIVCSTFPIILSKKSY